MTETGKRKRRSPLAPELMDLKLDTLTDLAQALNTRTRVYSVDHVDYDGDDWLGRSAGFYLVWDYSDEVLEAADTDPDPAAGDWLKRDKFSLKGRYLGYFYKHALATLQEKITQKAGDPAPGNE